MLLLAALLLVAEPAMHAPDRGCAGGAMIFFEPDSDDLDSEARTRLSSYAAASRRQSADSRIFIESGGDGALEDFDPALSLRRSQAIRAFLVAGGFASPRVHIEVRQLYGSRAPHSEDDALIDGRIGHVYELVSREENRRRYPSGVVTECF